MKKFRVTETTTKVAEYEVDNVEDEIEAEDVVRGMIIGRKIFLEREEIVRRMSGTSKLKTWWSPD